MKPARTEAQQFQRAARDNDSLFRRSTRLYDQANRVEIREKELHFRNEARDAELSMTKQARENDLKIRSHRNTMKMAHTEERQALRTATTELRRQIIQQKSFLWKIYDEWYRMMAEPLPVINKPVLELGSGAGFLGQYVSNLVTSEVFVCSKIDIVLNGLHLPFRNGSFSAIVMADVLHHLPDVRRFFSEASRCIPPGGLSV